MLEMKPSLAPNWVQLVKFQFFSLCVQCLVQPSLRLISSPKYKRGSEFKWLRVWAKISAPLPLTYQTTDFRQTGASVFCKMQQ